MIHIEETKQYNVYAQDMLSEAFERAYSRYADAQEAAPPDTATLIFSIISLLLVIGMLFLTAYRYKGEYTWYLLMAIFAFLIGRMIFRYWKARKEYLKAAGKPSTIAQKKLAFFSLFGGLDAVPATATAAELQDKVRPLLGKQSDTIYNTAIRSVAEDLILVNNPELPLCKLITPLSETFTQPRQRLYMKSVDDQLIFFDAEWQSPKGQITCDLADVVSFGKFSQYASGINFATGGKIRQDAVILEIRDEDKHLFFEFAGQGYATIRKILPGKKEKK